MTFIPLLFLVPLSGALILGLTRQRHKGNSAGWCAFLVSTLTFLVAVEFSRRVFFFGPFEWSADWFTVGHWKLNWGFRFDGLTALMSLMVSGIGSLIHLFSIGYMEHDEGRPRYFAFLNLFLAAMLMLVCASNLLVLFVGWEGVGLCSYLLIGFWFKDLKNTAAGMKAFVVNRIGDAGFLLGILGALSVLGTTDFGEMARLLETSSNLGPAPLGIIALSLFIGAIGKSAQLPLYVWLPDAMAGPTPVSALIHAATMVTAGVYLVVRLGFLFQVTPEVSQFIAYIGVATALFAASIACVQTDIKKVLAYSTVSQLGLMFLAAGVGGFQASLFHVFTHAFFKATLFLGAGCIIHALSGEQDISRMGGLRSKMPLTFLAFTVAVLAICGVPPLSGFFSKDAVLYATLVSSRGGTLLWILGLLVSLMTAFYMTRLYALVFFGRYTGDKHPHEVSSVMTLPLCGTALGALVAGVISVPHDWHLAPDWLGRILSAPTLIHDSASSMVSESLAMVIATSVGLMGMGSALYLYLGRGLRPSSESARGFHSVLWNRYWVDELYGEVFVKPFHIFSRGCALWIEPNVIDRAIMFTVRMAGFGAAAVSGLQCGRVQAYLVLMVGGALSAILWLGWGS